MSFKGWAKFFNDHAFKACSFFTLLTVVACFYVVKLYSNLKPDIEELLPTTARSVVDLKEVTTRLRSMDNLAVLIYSKNSALKNKDISSQFQEALVTELDKLPADTVAQVEYKITDELDFFNRRKSLFISTHDLSDVRNFIQKRIDYEKFIYNPLNLVIENKPNEPVFDFKTLEKRYRSQSDTYSHFPGGVYATEDGLNRLILVYAPNSSIITAHRLKDAVAKIVNDLHTGDIEVKYSGNVQDIIEEQAALLADLALSTVLVALLVSVVLLIYFRSLFATLALILSLLVGTAITFGISYFAVGYLNANSAFLGSIVMGNGINFGIMILARYLEERRTGGREHVEALEISLKETLLPTLTAALAAGLSYGSLMLTSFRGFSQFGMIGFIGMASCWICAYTYFPAILSLFNRKVSLAGQDRGAESRVLWSSILKGLLTHVPKLVAILGIVITLVSLFSLTHLNGGIIESDLTKLRDRHSMEQGSGFLTRDVDLILKRYSSPIAVLAQNEVQANKIAVNLKKLKASQGSHSMIENVIQVQDFIPPEQREKIRILKSIQETLSPRIMWHLSASEKQRVHEFVSPETLSPFGIKDLPVKLLDRFRERNGSFDHLVLVEPPLSDDIRQGSFLLQFVKEIREVVDEVGTEYGVRIPVAGRLPVSADMLSAILKEGPIATLVSFLAVLLLTILIFRNIPFSALVLGALVLGVLWMVGAMILFGLKINFLNFIALPITFGIGVDYAVNVFHRYREECLRRKGEQKIDATIAAVFHTGGAVVLASFTTVIGWGSLLIAGNQAFVSFGKIAVLGEVACVLVAVLIVPSFIITSQIRHK